MRNMKKHILAALIVVATLPLQLKAEELDKATYKKRVLEYSQQIAIAGENVVSAEAQVAQVETGYKPKIEGAAEFNQMMRQMSIDIGSYSLPIKNRAWSMGVTAYQNVYSGGAVRKQSKLAELGLEVARDNERLTYDKVSYSAEYAYWNMAAAIAVRQMAYRYLGIIEETHAVVKERFDDGLISRSDLLMLDTRLQEARLQVSTAETGYKQAAIMMNTLMGVPTDEPIDIADSIDAPLPPMPRLLSYEEVLEARPEYAIAMNNVSIGKQKLEVTRSAYLPSLAVGVTGQYATKSINVDDKGVLNGIAFARLSVPIFNWNEKKHKSAIDKSAVRVSEQELSATVDMIRQELSDAYTRMSASYGELVTAQKSMEVAEQSLQLNTFSYNEGLLTVLDVLSSQLSWLSAYSNLIVTNMNCRLAIADYMKASGNMDF